jgi:hypothetical protein
MNLKQAVEKSITAQRSREYNANFKLEIEGETWDCYSVSIANRDLLCYCKQGSVTILVDTFGNKTTCEIFDWEKSS